MTQGDPFDLARFMSAQDAVIAAAEAELAAGRKQSHWMWFVFPQLAALGRSPMALRYGIADCAEAQAYLAHPLLRARLERVTQLAIDAPAPSLRALFGSPDDMKFRSSMTLFAVAAGAGPSLFRTALDRWCAGEGDPLTLAELGTTL